MVDIQGGMPKNPQQMQAEQDEAVTQSLNNIKNKLLVMSGKGAPSNPSIRGTSGPCRSTSMIPTL